MWRARPWSALMIMIALAVWGCDGNDDAVDDSRPGDSSGTTSTTTEPVPTSAEIRSAIVATIEELPEAARVPGLAVAVVRDSEVVMDAAFGVDPATNDPIGTDTIFQVASVSKPLTAMAAVKLVEAGTLPWDSDIAAVLVSYELPPGAQSTEQPVTVERLLSHTAGTTIEGYIPYDPTGPIPTNVELLEGAGHNDPVVVDLEPGSTYRYSGGGYQVLEQAMVDATETDFVTLLDELVITPAALSSTTFAQPLPAALVERATAGFIGGEPIALFVNAAHAAGGLSTTAHDLGMLLIEYQQALTGEDSPLLSPAAARRLVDAAIATDYAFAGHGWFIDQAENPQWFWHPGSGLGFSARIAGSTDGHHGIVVLTNAREGFDAIDAIIDTVATIEDWKPPPP